MVGEVREVREVGEVEGDLSKFSNRSSRSNNQGAHLKTQTLGIIKPDAVAAGKAGKVLAHLEGAGFVVRAARMTRLSKAQAEAFYEVHKARPFYASLCSFMTSGPCIPMALERDDAVAHLRTVIGATDPKDAAAGTVRKLYAESKERNAIHASDSPENATREIAFFFVESELKGTWG